MNQFIRLAQAPAIAVVFASVWFSGCATPESGGRASVLSLPYGQFDQTFGSGWRPIFDRREYGKAAALIESSIHLTARTSPRRISIGWMRRWNGSSSRHGRATATGKRRLV